MSYLDESLRVIQVILQVDRLLQHLLLFVESDVERARLLEATAEHDALAEKRALLLLTAHSPVLLFVQQQSSLDTLLYICCRLATEQWHTYADAAVEHMCN